MLQKVLEKVFIIKKCKVSRSLKPDIFELPDNKYIGKLFSNNEMFLLDQAYFSSNTFKYCYYNIPSLELPYSSYHLCQSSPWSTETPLHCNPHHVLHRFSYFVLPHSTTRHNFWMYQTKC